MFKSKMKSIAPGLAAVGKLASQDKADKMPQPKKKNKLKFKD